VLTFKKGRARSDVPRPAYRSRSLRRVKTKTPGGRLVTHYEKRDRGVPRCPVTGLPLGGVNFKAYRFGIPRRAPSRPYGGVLSHRALARALKLAVRSESAAPQQS
jgi:large subunit ribosomal protein L34e